MDEIGCIVELAEKLGRDVRIVYADGLDVWFVSLDCNGHTLGEGETLAEALQKAVDASE